MGMIMIKAQKYMLMVWGFTLWLLITPVTPRGWYLLQLHRYLWAAKRWQYRRGADMRKAAPLQPKPGWDKR